MKKQTDLLPVSFTNPSLIKDADIVEEIKNSFLDYAMSVIVSRALPDARDGLKPVQRRIIYALHNLGLLHNKPPKKSARVIGEVIGKYHPHGESSIYQAMVRMAQDFNYRYLLVDGQGNFGSIDGDSAAAIRYTEVRMSALSEYLIKDIDKEVVAFQKNYDESEIEPKVLPAYFPNLLVNGAIGIAVGMSTSIPPHNLGEILDGAIALINNPELTISELLTYIKGPDFPTGGILADTGKLLDIYTTGHGSVVIKALYEIEQEKNYEKIIIKEIPFYVNKTHLLEKITQLIRDKHIDHISDLRDESNREGMRIIIELKRDQSAEFLMQKLYSMTTLKSSFSIILLALINGEPKILDLKAMLQVYIDFQYELLNNCAQFDLKEKIAKAHILAGYQIVLSQIDDTINLIKNATNLEQAREQLMATFKLTELQTKAILELRLSRLTKLETEKITKELSVLQTDIKALNFLLANKSKQTTTIIKQLQFLKDKFTDPRRTQIIPEVVQKLTYKTWVEKEEIVINLTKKGYIKRISLEDFRLQHRGGKGSKVVSIDKERDKDDLIEQILVTNTHSDLLFFSNAGKVYHLHAYKITNLSKSAKGMPLVNLISISKEEKIKRILSIELTDEAKYLLFITKLGCLIKNKISKFDKIQKNGKNVIILRKTDELMMVSLIEPETFVILASKYGKIIKFEENSIKMLKGNGKGALSLKLKVNDQVISACNSNEGEYLLSISAFGYGKITLFNEYRATKKRSTGVKIMTLKTNDYVVTVNAINRNEEIIIVTNEEKLIRISTAQIKISKRTAIGSKLISLDKGSYIVSVSIIKNIN